MAYSPSAVAPRYAYPAQPKTGAGFLRRLIVGMQRARLRQAETEIARYLVDTGGKFTDEAEREIERRYLSNATHL